MPAVCRAPLSSASESEEEEDDELVVLFRMFLWPCL